MDLISKLLEWGYNIFKYGVFACILVGLSISKQCNDQIFEACNLITFGHYCQSEPEVKLQDAEWVDPPAPIKVKHGRSHK